jgi:methylated-DNA-[protein]-cysteine S-methyltransferase
MSQAFHIFKTAIGSAGLAWGDKGLIGVHLPESESANVRRLLNGEKPDLLNLRIDDTRVPDFNRRVYAIARAIPPGETLTYGEIATQLGDKLLARNVGQALGANPWPIVVPCHRITAAGGKLGGFSARGGQETKLKLLAIEGAAVAAQGNLFL